MVSVHEEWRPVFGIEGYEVSSFGRARSLDRTIEVQQHGRRVVKQLKGRVLKPGRHVAGYPQVNFGKNGVRSVHSLVAEAWKGPQPAGYHVNHINGIKTDNRPENLEYVTPRENVLHARATGLMGDNAGENHVNAKNTEDAIRFGHRLIQDGASIVEAARVSGSNYDVLKQAIKGKCWKHLGLARIGALRPGPRSKKKTHSKET